MPFDQLTTAERDACLNTLRDIYALTVENLPVTTGSGARPGCRQGVPGTFLGIAGW
jgi:hypothetical protein